MFFTRNGDKGFSGLFGTKERLPKDAPVFDALGTLDELNALLGLCRAHAIDTDLEMSRQVFDMQENLFIIQSEIAGSGKSLTQKHVEGLETTINNTEARAGNPHAFVIAGTTTLSALFDVARTVARRAERAVITANETTNISPESRAYLNRLSSGLYALARLCAATSGAKELSPSY